MRIFYPVVVFVYMSWFDCYPDFLCMQCPLITFLCCPLEFVELEAGYLMISFLRSAIWVGMRSPSSQADHLAQMRIIVATSTHCYVIGVLKQCGELALYSEFPYDRSHHEKKSRHRVGTAERDDVERNVANLAHSSANYSILIA